MGSFPQVDPRYGKVLAEKATFQLQKDYDDNFFI